MKGRGSCGSIFRMAIIVTGVALLPLAGCNNSSTPLPPPTAAAFQVGDTLPGYLHVLPRGSRADVVAKGRYLNGQWTVEICRLLDTGHADDAKFQVGVDTVFSIAMTDNSGGTHNGARRIDLTWQGVPQWQSVVVGDLATLGASAPVIDGDASDQAWSAAPTSSLALYPMAGNNGITGATVQAAWLDRFIYFRVTWSDSTENTRRKHWSYDGNTWTRGGENEDRLYFMFEIVGAMGTSSPGFMSGTTTPFSRGGCTISCHGDGVMRLDAGRVDTWHWKATRTDPAGFLDDKFMVAADPGQNGRKSDEGTAAYIENKDTAGTGPGWRSARGYNANPDFLFMLPGDHDFTVARTDDAGFAAGNILPGYVQRVPGNSRADVWTKGKFDNGTWTVEFCRALDSGSTWETGGPVRLREDLSWRNGDTVPGYVTVPPIGSFGDVKAMGRWVGGFWTVEICRDLDTGNPDDVVFATNDTMVMSLGVTDNSGGTHNGAPSVNLEWAGLAGPMTVVAEPLGATPPPSIDGAGSDAAWAAAQTSSVPLTPQSGANRIYGVDVQAVRDGSRIYFKFVWEDPTRNEFREQWTYANGVWSQNSQNEDRLYVMFDIDGARGTGTPGADDGLGATPFTGGAPGGCTVLCHGDGRMRTGSGTIDTWHWKATRNNGSGWLDDKNADSSDRHKDDGAGLGTRNRNAAKTMPNYQAFADPGARALHLPFQGKASADDAAFVVGYTLPFALGLTDNAGGSHDGSPLLHLKWSGISIPTELVALDLAQTGAPPPVIDGVGTDGAWGLASPADVVCTPQSGGGFGITAAELRAVHDRDHIYVRVIWTDPSGTRDQLKKRRVFDGAAWSSTGARDEDRVFFLWSMGEALGTASVGQVDGTTTPFRVVGCAMACHGDGKMRTASGKLDAWHWKAARTNGLGYTDDKYFTAAALGVSGRKGDFGRSSHFDNGTATAPTFRARSGPGANYTYLAEPLVSGAQRALSLAPAANVPPQSNAGPNQTVQAGDPVTLDGRASFDPNPGDAITFAWTQTGGTLVALSGANTATPTFTAPGSATTLTFDLTVSDGLLQDTDTTQVDVQVGPIIFSYSADIHPIWTARGCTVCHLPGGSGAVMDLSGTPPATWPVLMAGRINLGSPADSLILKKPLAFAVSSVAHGGGDIFLTTGDLDYQKILAWITQGAPNN